VLNSKADDGGGGGACSGQQYVNAVTRVVGLAPGTTYHFSLETVDDGGTTSGPKAIGTYTTPVDVKFVPTPGMSMDAHMMQYWGNITQDGDLLRFNGSDSYVRFADMEASGVDFGTHLQSASFSMTFWTKPVTNDEARFFVVRKPDIGIFLVILVI
jgi:hypothetical protein